MQPMPIESLKKARPSAVRTTAGVIFARSGLNRKLSPALAPGSVRLRAQSTSSRMKSSGINLRVTASMPLATPNMMMLPVTASTTHCQSSELSGLATSSANTAPATCRSVVAICPAMALKT
jgi:hypothetical protein